MVPWAWWFPFFACVKKITADGVGSLKKRARREGFRFQMELNFGQKEDEDHFIARLD